MWGADLHACADTCACTHVCAEPRASAGCKSRQPGGPEGPAARSACPAPAETLRHGVWQHFSGTGWHKFNSVARNDENLTLIGKSGHKKPLVWVCQAKK